MYLTRASENNVNHQQPTTHHGTSPRRRSGTPKLLASYIMNLF